jgi:hypothetical protein
MMHNPAIYDNVLYRIYRRSRFVARPTIPEDRFPSSEPNAYTAAPNPYERISAASALADAVPSFKSNPSEWMYERLVRSIIEFESKLDSDSEIGARLVNFNSNEVISIDDLGFWGPDLVKFYGKNADGRHVELMQHLTQVNVLLVGVPKQSEKPKRIGFILEENLKKQDEE